MNNSWIYFLILTFTCLFLQGFFAMFEMASVSFNPIRLKYFYLKEHKRATQLHYLLSKPSRLFGTTLICVNFFLQIGSEAARRFYESLSLSPDFAPITQIFLVLIFAELTPLFTARRHYQQIALGTVPLVYVLSRILFPVVFVIEKFFLLINRFPEKSPLALSRDEILRTFEESEEKKTEDSVIENILVFKKKNARDIMRALQEIPQFSSAIKIGEMQEIMHKKYSPFFLIYHQKPSHIVSIGDLRDFLEEDKNQSVMQCAKAPWFVLETASLFEILEQFKRNKQKVCVVLNSLGRSIGIITLDYFLQELMGKKLSMGFVSKNIVIDKVVNGTMSVEKFNALFHCNFSDSQLSIAEYIEARLGHLPHLKEKWQEQDLSLIVEEVTLTGVKKIRVRSSR